MVRRCGFAAGIAFFTALLAQADTVTTKDSRSWNGQASIQGGVLTLNASFPKGNQSLKFPANYLRALELNGTTFNPGAPPSLPRSNPGRLSGTVYSKDRTEKEATCDDIRLDQANVTCTAAEKGKGKPKTWNRDDVIRIIIK